ncbi:MAG: PilZ domain-containing protein [Desulfobacterales bacterium]|nr:PilZ domain-containing protein [Desulfobacterales bacterium]
MENERRRFTRLVFKRDEIQVFSDDLILFGKLNDISNGGLSFRYTPIAGKNMDTKSINILPNGKDQFNLYHIVCLTIYDISAFEEGQNLTGNEKRQCGIKFFEFKENQKDKLAFLLKNYAVESFDSSSGSGNEPGAEFGNQGMTGR